MKQYEIRFQLDRPREEVFTYLSDVKNLDLMTPDWLRFKVLTPAPHLIKLGSKFDYRLSWRRFPLRWRSEITVWQPPNLFTYEQRRGPYRRWIHDHFFEEYRGGTLVIDRVRYAPFVAPLVGHRVAADVRSIFAFRAKYLKDLFGSSESGAYARPPAYSAT